nr:MAG TPA: hypothetical protein [Caudoviricetes sp.]
MLEKKLEVSWKRLKNWGFGCLRKRSLRRNFWRFNLNKKL